jgi:hypothetical protein
MARVRTYKIIVLVILYHISVIHFFKLQTPRDCGFFEWADPMTPDFLKELLLDMKNVVFKLKRERTEAGGDEHCDKDVQQVTELNHLLQRQLLKKDAELQAKNKELEALQGKMQKGGNNLVAWCCVFVLGMFFSMLLNGVKMP